MSYMRQKYIDSVDGPAHQSACEIISELEEALNDFVTKYCDREGDDDFPLPPNEQENELVKNAMILLDL